MLNIVSCWGARNAMKIYSQLHSQCSSSRGWASPEEEVMAVVTELWTQNFPLEFPVVGAILTALPCHSHSGLLRTLELEPPFCLVIMTWKLKYHYLGWASTPGGPGFQKWGIKPKHIVAKGSMAGLVLRAGGFLMMHGRLEMLTLKSQFSGHNFRSCLG